VYSVSVYTTDATISTTTTTTLLVLLQSNSCSPGEPGSAGSPLGRPPPPVPEEDLRINGMAIFIRQMSFLPPPQSSVSKHWRKHKAQSVISGLDYTPGCEPHSVAASQLLFCQQFEHILLAMQSNHRRQTQCLYGMDGQIFYQSNTVSIWHGWTDILPVSVSRNNNPARSGHLLKQMFH